MLPTTTIPLAPGYAWLTKASPDSGLRRAALRTLEAGQSSVLPVGTLFDVVRTAACTGLHVIEQLQRDRVRIGPVLLSTEPARTYFLVPPGTTTGWKAPGSRMLKPELDHLAAPAAQSCDGRIWLVPPDGTGHLTDPAALNAALHRVADAPDDTPHIGATQ